MDTRFNEHLTRLEALLQSYGSVAVGYSGGVDSTFLAAVCARCLPENTLLVHLDSPLAGTPEREACAAGLARLGLPVLELPFDPLAEHAVAVNPPERCYHCKLAGFRQITAAARERGVAVTVDGSNADDAADTRPGIRALRELGVRSPLMETGWRKDDERALLRAWGYPVWSLPAGACLATRIPCGEALTQDKLAVVRACEDYLHERGLNQVRVRLAGGRAHVAAAPADLARLREFYAAETREENDDAGIASGGARGGVADNAAPLPASIVTALRERGAAQVDPCARPYRSGAMNS